MKQSTDDNIWLEVKNLSSRPHGRSRFSAIDLNLQRGELYAVVGQNGSGKTSLLKALCGLIPSSSDRFKINGQDLAKWNIRKRAQHFTWLSSEFFLAFDYTPLDLMNLFCARIQAQTFQQNKIERFKEELQRWGMLSYILTPISQMSAGQRQLILIACAISRQTECMILDEPCVHLDFTMSEKVHRRLRTLAHEENRLVVFSTHDLTSAKKFADQMIAIKKGRLLITGPIREYLNDSNLESIFFSD